MCSTLQPDSLGRQSRLLRELDCFVCLAPHPCCRLPVGGADRVSTSPSSALIWLVLFCSIIPAAGYLSEVQQIAGPFLVVVPLSTVPNWIRCVLRCAVLCCAALRCAALQPGSSLGRLRPALVDRVEAGSGRQC